MLLTSAIARCLATHIFSADMVVSLTINIYKVRRLLMSISDVLSRPRTVKKDGAVNRVIRVLAPVSVDVNPEVASPTDSCNVYCYQSWLKCVSEHGSNAKAEQLCSCLVFSDPINLCRNGRFTSLESSKVLRLC
jgi:hypothetical protein